MINSNSILRGRLSENLSAPVFAVTGDANELQSIYLSETLDTRLIGWFMDTVLLTCKGLR